MRISRQDIIGPIGGIWEEIEELGIYVPQSLNPPPDLPISRASGTQIGLSEVRFTYSGPNRQILVAWGIKPSGMLNFNHGQYLIPGVWGSTPMISVVESTTPIVVTFSPATAQVTVPAPGTYTSKGNAKTGHPPVSVTINRGTFDTWVWVYNASQAAWDAAGTWDPDVMTWEKYLLVVDTDANVGAIPDVPTVKLLDVRYVAV